MATYFIRAIALMVGLLTFGALYQSYQISSSLISQEINRTAQQTSSLIQSLFDFRLSLLKIHQDSSAINPELLEAVSQKDSAAIEHFFRNLDQIDPDNIPDVRIIGDLNNMVWSDGNAQFYGFIESDLKLLYQHLSINNYWILTPLASTTPTPTYVLTRRTALVDVATGEVDGALVVLFVLNNNFSLIEQLRSQSNSESLILSIDGQILSSTLNGTENYDIEDIYSKQIVERISHDHSVYTTKLLLDDIPSSLVISSILRSVNIAKLEKNFRFGVAFMLLAMACFSYLLWNWLHSKIRSEIESLMLFTHTMVEEGKQVSFSGSSVSEFDHFGRVLERLFKQLSEQERQFENLFNSSISPTILWGIDGRLIRMNPAAVNYFADDIFQSQQRFYQLKQSLVPQITRISAGEVLDEIITEIDEKTFRWSISPIFSDVAIECILTQGQDITSIAEAEKQSRVARQEAEQTSQARADFLARMSHEVRTPLNGILGVAQLMQSKAYDDAHKEQIGVLSTCSEHLLAVLNDILDFSKIEQNKFQINVSEFHISDTLQAIERIYQPLCQDKLITLLVKSTVSEDLILNTDPIRLNQIIFNLLNNAVKFTHSGSINVWLDLVVQEERAMLKFTVCDTGIGIASTDLLRIFEPFVQAQLPTVREYGGSGLGLSIVKNLVELLGGQIYVKSSIGDGSEFWFTVPITLDLASADRPKPQHVVQTLPLFDWRPNVLLVEDNKTNAYIAKAFCEKYGLNVTWAHDGNSALECIQTDLFDLILMDNQLPTMDGIEVTRIMKEKFGVTCPIYACTADGMAQTKDAFIDVGAEYVIVKPIREESFLQALMHFKQHRELDRALIK
jgi:two-component system autoinducer 2 sensor kinase/phosphatase LuxQ